jgi:hypothetical protein
VVALLASQKPAAVVELHLRLSSLCRVHSDSKRRRSVEKSSRDSGRWHIGRYREDQVVELLETSCGDVSGGIRINIRYLK